MPLVIIIILNCIMELVTANQNCPDNLSQNCYCTDENQTVYCKFKMNDSFEIFNSSLTKPSMVNLTKLDISNNNLSMLPTNFLDGIYSLQDLDLSENNLATLPMILHTSIASSIKNLNMSFNSIMAVDDFTFSSMNALEILDISNNQLNTVKDHTFVNNRYLWYLDLSNNKLELLSSTSFQGLENSIRNLDVSSNNLSSLEKEVFGDLHNLKSLKLSQISNSWPLFELDFPQHLVLLDLSLSGIKEFDDCRLLKLTDLEYLNLNGNPLTCSCHLLWLHQRMVHNQETDNIHTIHQLENNDWTCINIGGSTTKVADLHIDCSGHYFLNNPDHCEKLHEPSNNFDEQKWKENLSFETVKGDNEVSVKWHRYNASAFFGYEIQIFDDNQNKIYNSPTLHPTVKKYTAQSEELKSGTYQVCLNILYNETQIIGSVCNEVVYLDLQIIVGILAGIIFLIPCIAALVYIMCLDKKQFMSYTDYSELSKSIVDTNVAKKEQTKTEKNGSKQKPTKKSKPQKDRLTIPTITVHDYTLTNVHSTDSISPDDKNIFPMVRSTERILPDDEISIEPDGDSGSSAGIRIDIPSADNETGLTNEGYSEDGAKGCDVKL